MFFSLCFSLYVFLFTFFCLRFSVYVFLVLLLLETKNIPLKQKALEDTFIMFPADQSVRSF